MTVLHIEADEIVYRAAFAVERTCYIIQYEDGREYDLVDRFTLTQIKKSKLRRGLVLNKDYYLERYIKAEPLEHCLKLIKNTLEELSEYGTLNLWLSPSDNSNFRYGIAKTPGPRGQGYKAGRDRKPIYLQEARDYVKNSWGATEISGLEADDALGIYQNNNTIAVHVDKDINMIQGRHLNWLTKEEYTVPDGLGTVELRGKKVVGRGLKFFYHQLLTGDKQTDNIPGCPGIGDKTAYTLLKDCETEEECFDVIVSTYKKKYPENTLEILEEMADLLWICRDRHRTGRDVLRRLYWWI